MMEAVKQTRARIFNNGSSGSTNDAVLDISIPIPVSESFDENNTGMTGIGLKDKDG